MRASGAGPQRLSHSTFRDSWWTVAQMLAQVQKMVKAILSLQAAPKPSHASDALAVAICHALAPPLLKVAG